MKHSQKLPNNADAPNAAMMLRFHAEHHWRGVGDLRRSAIRMLESTLRPFVVGVVGVCCGCAPTVSQQEFLRAAAIHDSNCYPKHTYYCGSKNGYDYFAVNQTGSTLSSSKEMRVAESQETVSMRFPYARDSASWRPFADFHRSAR